MADPFLFEIETDNTEILSAKLAFIIAAHLTDGPPMLRFNEQAAGYSDNAFTGKAESSNWGLLYIANEYLGK